MSSKPAVTRYMMNLFVEAIESGYITMVGIRKIYQCPELTINDNYMVRTYLYSNTTFLRTITVCCMAILNTCQLLDTAHRQAELRILTDGRYWEYPKVRDFLTRSGSNIIVRRSPNGCRMEEIEYHRWPKTRTVKSIVRRIDSSTFMEVCEKALEEEG
jgi:hypothetical protein